MWQYNYSNNYVLCHHGIKGQRWGVRRYQNPDGSLTPAGKKRMYRQDKKNLKKLFADAEEASRWSEVYNRKTKRDDNILSSRIDKDMKKYGSLSDKTEKKQAENIQLHKQKQIADQLTDQKISRARSYTEYLRDKYGDKKIKDIKTRTDNGREYVKRNLNSDISSEYRLIKRTQYEYDGDKKVYKVVYTPTKILHPYD